MHMRRFYKSIYMIPYTSINPVRTQRHAYCTNKFQEKSNSGSRPQNTLINIDKRITKIEKHIFSYDRILLFLVGTQVGLFILLILK